ncbi:hypothetical protein F2Q70_00040728 [Brassica cretica]|uniref:Uncharacterized protein n=1 Tax=Brassica cretica TaxID=69181 RepID=A0A8S9K1G0_BRACR|nr:hypothetical protein F2Q70_00040728 [Brassica cretica]
MVEMGETRACGGRIWEELTTKLRLTPSERRFSTLLNPRLYYTCANVADGDCHVWKWWDVAVMEKMRARDTHTLQLAEKVDYLAGMSDYWTELNQIKDLQYETEQKMVRLEKLVSELGMWLMV